MKNILTKLIKITRVVLLPGIIGFAVILTITHFIWKSSGSNEWELVRDENGVKVYTLKSPGSTLLKVKANMRIKTSLSSAAFLLRGDVTTADDFGGKDFEVLQQIETESLFLAYYSVKHVMPPPFRTKELVLMLNYTQDKKNKEVEINVQAAPSRIPPTENTSRVTHLNNIFRLTPYPNGEIDWEITLDVDMGIYYPLANLSMPDYLYKDLTYHRDLVMTEKYQNAKLVSIQEI